MSRNLQLQHLRGTYAQLLMLQSGIDPDTGNATNPLQLGEIYFATDQLNFYIGTPVYTSSGFVQIGDTTKVNETLKAILLVLEAQRRALAVLACGDRGANHKDFEVATISAEIRDAEELVL